MLPKLLVSRAGDQKDASFTYRVCGGGVLPSPCFCSVDAPLRPLRLDLATLFVFPVRLQAEEVEEAQLGPHPRVHREVSCKCLRKQLLNPTPVLSDFQFPEPDPQGALFHMGIAQRCSDLLAYPQKREKNWRIFLGKSNEACPSWWLGVIASFSLGILFYRGAVSQVHVGLQKSHRVGRALTKTAP